MSEMSRTAARIANLHLFEPDQLIIGVEGPDDVPFWRRVFPSQHQGMPIRIVPGEGKEALLQVWPRIRDGKTMRTLVAIDSEYDDVIRDKPRHGCVVKTGRHSIENYLYDPLVVDKVACLCCRADDGEVTVGAAWAAGVVEAFQDLLFADCTAIRLGASMKVMGDSCAEFLVKDSHLPETPRITARLNECGEVMTAAQLAATRRRFSGRQLFHYVKGHFLTTSVRRRIQAEATLRRGRKFRLLDDEMLPTFLPALETVWAQIPDAARLKRRARRALRQVLR